MDYIYSKGDLLASFYQNPFNSVLGYGSGFIITIIIWAIVSYLIPVAILKFMKDRSFKSAFNFKYIISKVLTGKYLMATVIVWIVGVSIFLVIRKIFPTNVIKEPMLLLTSKNLLLLIVSVIVSSFIKFIRSIFIFTVYGNVLKELK